MLTQPEWQPPLGWVALTVLMILWAAGASWRLYRFMSQRTEVAIAA
jgi:hypothetical protein